MKAAEAARLIAIMIGYGLRLSCSVVLVATGDNKTMAGAPSRP